MNKQELIKRIEELPYNEGLIVDTIKISRKGLLELVSQLDKPETGHEDEAPRYVKNILARLRELPLHNREVWLKAIMGEFEQDFSHAKWREGYEQGKLEGAWVGNQLKDADKIRSELNKVQVPQFVADWYEENKDDFEGNLYRCAYNIPSSFDGAKLNEFERWFLTAGTKFQTLVNMHQFGYIVEEEKKYKITLLNRNDGDLYLVNQNANLADKYGHFSPVVLLFTKCTNFSEKCYKLTKKEVVSHDFGWVFDCEGIEIEEVDD